jgi:general L-amino acid transport system permease protein
MRSARLRLLLTWLVIGLLLWPLLSWAIVHAVWRPDLETCRALRGTGACWGVIAEKHRILLFGRYPYAEQWRPFLATLLMIGTLILATQKYFWRPAFAAAGVLTVLAAVFLMAGGLGPLAHVDTKEWGGLPLTLLVSIGGTLAAFPAAVLLALGRRSTQPLLRLLCTGYIELIRSVPLISLLFMAAFLFPLLLPAGSHVDILPRVILTVAAFAAAYLAEVIRSGLQTVGQGQYQAARACQPWLTASSVFSRTAR